MKMHRFFHFDITDTRYWERTIKTRYFKKFHEVQLYILNIYEENSAALTSSDPNSDQIGYEFGGDDLEDKIIKQIVSEDYYEISEKEFMRYVDELFPRWRELKFNKKTKEMYYPEEEQQT